MDGQTAADLDVARTRLPRLVAWYFTRGHSCAPVRGRPPAAVLPLGLQPCNAGLRLQPLQLLSDSALQTLTAARQEMECVRQTKIRSMLLTNPG